MTHDEVRKRAKDEGIEFFLAQFVEMHGKPNAKLMPVQAIDDLLEEGAGFAGFAAGPMGQTPASPDMLAVPDPSSLHARAVAARARALRLQRDGRGRGLAVLPAHDPAQRRRAGREARLPPEDGLEAEFFLVQDENGQLVVDDPLDTSEQPCYDVKALYRNYEFLTTLSRYANELGYGNYANDHEDANGQFESNFAYDDALITCDRAIFFRYMVHVMAQQRGKLATFMPKPFGHLTGNGCHFHISLWDQPGRRTSSTARTRAARPLRARLPVHRGRDRPRRGLSRSSRPRSTRTSASASARRLGRDLVAGLRLVGREQPHADDPHAGRPAHRAPRHRRLRQPVPGGGGDAGAGPRRHRRKLDPGRQNTANLYTARAQEVRRSASRPAHHAADACGGSQGRRPARLVREHRHRALRRLLRQDQARGVRRLPRGRLRAGRSTATSRSSRWSTSPTGTTSPPSGSTAEGSDIDALWQNLGRRGAARSNVGLNRLRFEPGRRPDARARPRRRGGDLLRARGQRAVVAGGGDARGARGRLPRLPAELRARTR